MLKPVVLAVAALMALAGCQMVDGVEGLAVELQARGLPAEVKGTFNGTLLGGDGTTVCVGAETLSVYAFPNAAQAQAAAETINRDDPSLIGNSIVEWIGPPRFWLRDRLIIQYVGEDVALDTGLRNVLGPPIAEAQGGGQAFVGKRNCEEP